MSENGKQAFDLVAAAREAAPAALETLAQLVRNPATDPEVRIAAANALLDRALVRPERHSTLRALLAKLEAAQKQRPRRARRAAAERRP